MKKKTLTIVPILVVAFMLLSPPEAKAWRLFGKETDHEYGYVEGSCAKIHTDGGTYFFGIRVGSWSNEETVNCL
jgi:hypothetical protein